ncbi:hypothetical protein BN59_01361 [Legionella massiliensis]|uniref:Uncharacterized protein n=1 Tax=Legionella massiliensis TaxID=1034943 RepID=A0A078KVP7_9GAMM|nr:hypothetical protein [Legionella massiliensis]CDZ77082.1 hypothetical protein BN59_01361 [Legionella massiliensis]CEE12820.1 hypothetical protein BN1094_01361 [Legionella massiliensis]
MQEKLEQLPLNKKQPLNNLMYTYDTDGQRAKRHTELQALVLDYFYDIAANWLNAHPEQLAKYHNLPKYTVNHRKNPLHTSAIFAIAFDLMESEEVFQLYQKRPNRPNVPLKELMANPTTGPLQTVVLPEGSVLEETDVYLALQHYIYCQPEKFAKFKEGTQAPHEKTFTLPPFIKPEYQDNYLAILSAPLHSESQVQLGLQVQRDQQLNTGLHSQRFHTPKLSQDHKYTKQLVAQFIHNLAIEHNFEKLAAGAHVTIPQGSFGNTTPFRTGKSYRLGTYYVSTLSISASFNKEGQLEFYRSLTGNGSDWRRISDLEALENFDLIKELAASQEAKNLAAMEKAENENVEVCTIS